MRYLVLLSLFLCTTYGFAQKGKPASSFIKALPTPHRAVNDFGRFLDASERQWLENELAGYLEKTTNAIVLITLDSLTDPITNKQYTVEETALQYFNTWGIGDKVKNNGVLLLVSRSPRRVRIEVGTGLDTVLTNATCQEIVDNSLVPNFKQGLFFAGIKEAVLAIEQRLDHPLSAEQQNEIAPYLRPTIIKKESVDVPYKKPNPVIGFVIIGGILGVCILVIKFVRPLSSGWYTSSGYTPRSYYDGSFQSYSSGSGWSSSGGSSFSSGGSSYGGGSSSGGGASGSW